MKPLDDYNIEISLPDFYNQFIGKIEPQKGSSAKNPKYAHFATDEKGNYIFDDLGNKTKLASLVFFKDDKGIQKVYINSNNKERPSGYYNVISLLQSERGGREKFNLGKVRGELDKYMQSENFISPEDSTINIPRSKDKRTIPKEQVYNLIKDVNTYPIKTDRDKLYLYSRGFDADEIISSAEFKGLVELSASNKGKLNTTYRFRDEKFNTTGFLQKFNLLDTKRTVKTEHGEYITYDTFKHFNGIKTAGAFLSNVVADKTIKNFVLVEGVEDAFAHWKKNQNTLKPNEYNFYIGSGGNYDSNFEKLFFELKNELKPRGVVAAFDNDLAGRRFALDILKRSEQTMTHVTAQAELKVTDKPVLLDIKIGEFSHDRDYVSFIFNPNTQTDQNFSEKLKTKMYSEEANRYYQTIRDNLAELNIKSDYSEQEFNITTDTYSGVHEIKVDFPKDSKNLEKIPGIINNSQFSIDVPKSKDWNQDLLIAKANEKGLNAMKHKEKSSQNLQSQEQSNDNSLGL